MGREQSVLAKSSSSAHPNKVCTWQKVSRPSGPCYGFSPRRCHCCPGSGASPCSKRQWPRRILAWHPFHAECFIPAEHEHGSAGGDGGIRARGGYRVILRGGAPPQRGAAGGVEVGGTTGGGARRQNACGDPPGTSNGRKRPSP